MKGEGTAVSRDDSGVGGWMHVDVNMIGRQGTVGVVAARCSRNHFGVLGAGNIRQRKDAGLDAGCVNTGRVVVDSKDLRNETWGVGGRNILDGVGGRVDGIDEGGIDDIAVDDVVVRGRGYKCMKTGALVGESLVGERVGAPSVDRIVDLVVDVRKAHLKNVGKRSQGGRWREGEVGSSVTGIDDGVVGKARPRVAQTFVVVVMRVTHGACGDQAGKTGS
ncbi:hypothetical protein HK102_000584 [Quaeritorhiza haematococci]|nr:hypothetical protein HK102_000584 [Quaeritorhiza haematococci]